MPELPEVTTTVKGLNKTIKGLVVSDVWTDLARSKTIKQFNETIKNEKFFKKFKKETIGAKVVKVERRAKNILIFLNNKKVILIHLKMTGHLLFGEYTKKLITKDKLLITNWEPKKDGPLKDPYNRFIHFVITFSIPSTKLRASGKQLVMSDSRKFGKITLLDEKMLNATCNMLHDLGPEPLEKNFTLQKFKFQILKKPDGRIKTVLMDQKIIAGIGNIYSDEMLWLSSIHPESKPKNIPDKKLAELYRAMRQVLTKGIDFGGDSMSDYRNIDGEKGNFQHHHNVYQKKNEKCGKKNCSGIITRKTIGSRSAHFCNKHQILF